MVVSNCVCLQALSDTSSPPFASRSDLPEVGECRHGVSGVHIGSSLWWVAAVFRALGLRSEAACG